MMSLRLPLLGRLADRGLPGDDVHRRRNEGGHRASFVWVVTQVPPGYEAFQGRRFRWTDLKFGDWPSGFRFRNVKTGQEFAP